MRYKYEVPYAPMHFLSSHPQGTWSGLVVGSNDVPWRAQQRHVAERTCTTVSSVEQRFSGGEDVALIPTHFFMEIYKTRSDLSLAAL